RACRRASDRPAAAGGLGRRRPAARRRRGSRAGQLAALGRGPATARRHGGRDDRMSGADGAAASVEAERVLRQNWHEGERGGLRFPSPERSPGRSPWQWYWDSCSAAIVWRRFEPARAKAELESLLEAQRPDGFVGHTIFWREPVSWIRLAFYN